MYIYLDKQGVVKEIINDEALRQSASNVNEIYVYYDGLQESDIGGVLATYGLPDGTITDEMQVATQTQESEIPYNAERDLKYFQYYKAYAFYHFTIADLALSQEGVVRLMLRLAQKDGEYIKVAGLICFDVEGELVKEDHGVSLAQYNYLVKTWYDTKECLPLDGSKAMRADLDMGSHSVVLNGKALKGNNGALNYNGKDLAKQEDVSSLQNDVSSLKQDNTKNKADIASLKTDNTANKADISALKADNTKNKSDIVGLQTQVDTINATQNVVDIVGTKAELNAYVTKDLHANDKIEVLVDESQNDANTIYEWNGKVWTLVGSKAPYYSKAESDARYNELKAKSYDKDTTGYVTGHVPDSGLVKGSLDSISESVETLFIEAVKKNMDASLKSVTIPTANDLKTKDGSTFGSDTSPWKVVGDDSIWGYEYRDGTTYQLLGITPSASGLIQKIQDSNADDPLDLVLLFSTSAALSGGEDGGLFICVNNLSNATSNVTLPSDFATKSQTINLGDINTNKNDIATLKTKSYDKDATLDDLMQGHVPDSNVVKGISVDVKAHKQMLDTLGDEVIKSVKKDTDASLKSLTLPSISDFKTKDGSSFGDTIPTLEITQTDDGMVLTSSSLAIVKSRVGTHSPIGKATIDFGGQTIIVTFYESAKLSEGFDHPFICSPMFINLGIINVWSIVTINLDTGEIETFSLSNYSGFAINDTNVILADDSFANYYGTMYVDTINGKPIISGTESKDIKLQPTLVSGTNIKTINGNSILGEGDMSVQPKLYHHTITLHNTATPSYFAFEADITRQAEITKDTLFNVMNGRIVVGTGVVQNFLINKITFHNTDEKTKVHQYASFGTSGYINADVVFKDVFGTDYTLEDVTYPLS